MTTYTLYVNGTQVDSGVSSVVARGLVEYYDRCGNVCRLEADEEYTGVLNADGYHSEEYPFCPDMSCDCHEDRAEVYNVAQYIEDGEMTTDEADRYYHGKTI